MVHPRNLVPSMSAVAALTSVNFLTAEAVAVSLILEAPIVVSTRSALMDRAACRECKRTYENTSENFDLVL